MNTQEAAEYCGVTTSVILYVARRDQIGSKQNGRWSFTVDELDKVFGASPPLVARLQAEIKHLRERLEQSGAPMDEQHPQHQRLLEVKDRAETIGDFLDWLAAGGYCICLWRDAGNNGQARYIPATSQQLRTIRDEEGYFEYSEAKRDGIENPAYDSWPPGFVQVERQVEEWIALFFGIDRQALEAEKRAMLAAQRLETATRAAKNETQ